MPVARLLLALVVVAVAAVAVAARGGALAERPSPPAEPRAERPAASPARVAPTPAPAAPVEPRAKRLAPRQAQPTPAPARRARAGGGWRLRLDRPAAFALAPPGGPRAGLLADLDSGRVLWRAGARRAVPVASLTKVMTALLVARSTRVGERALVTRDAVRVRGSKVGLAVGERVGVQALMHAMLLASGNDAAAVLARHAAGSEAAFVRRMNRRARALGLRCTRFVNPHGVGRRNRSCPADLARLGRAALAVPRIARIVARRTARVRLGGAERTLTTTNPLLRAGEPGVLGLKTGTSRSAGRCLVAVVRRGGRRLVAVVLRSGDPGGDVRALLARAA